MKIIVGLLMTACLGVSALAQQDAKVVAEMSASTDKIVKGSPFSADAISESVQTLADGNRIVHTTNTKMFRNTDGRFRRDISSGSSNVPGASFNVGYSTTILDPVAGSRYTFNDKEKVARQYILRTPTPLVKIAGSNGMGGATGFTTTASMADRERATVALKTRLDGSAEGQNSGGDVSVASGGRVIDAQRMVELEKATVAQGHSIDAKRIVELDQAATALRAAAPSVGVVGQGMGVMTALPTIAPIAMGSGGTMVYSTDSVKSRYESRTEKLGTQNFEGVDAEGTRTTTTIPAGAIGNDRPIEIVYESWYSKDLQLTVFSKHSDPRFGEQTYRLTNISRSDPDPSVFALPSGYRIVSQTTPGVFTAVPARKTATPATEAKAAQQPTPGTTRARP